MGGLWPWFGSFDKLLTFGVERSPHAIWPFGVVTSIHRKARRLRAVLSVWVDLWVLERPEPLLECRQ